MIVKIIIISLITIFISSALKNYNNELGNFVSIAGGIIIFLLCANELSEIISYFIEINDYIDIENQYIVLIFKVIGIGYITEFTADIAEDFGNKIMASRVILGGKIVICGIAIPVIKKLLILLFSFLS